MNWLEIVLFILLDVLPFAWLIFVIVRVIKVEKQEKQAQHIPEYVYLPPEHGSFD